MTDCKLSFVCSEEWAQLVEGADPRVRYCKNCQADVHAVYNDDELEDQKAKGHCVAIFEDAGLVATMGLPNLALPQAIDPILDRPLAEFDLPPHILQALEREGTTLLGQLISKTEIATLRIFLGSRTDFNILKEFLALRGLTFGMKLNGWQPKY
jgi:hypothetical protein